MTRLIILFSLFCLATPLALAQPDYAEESYFVKVWLEPAKVAVGQKMTMNVMFATDSYFSNPARIVLPEIEHVLMLETEPSLNGQQTLDGRYFTTLTRFIDIYPEQEGVVRIPSFAVSFGQPITDNDGFKTTTVRLSTESLLALVRTPPGMQGLNGYMVSDEVKITDDWQGLKDTEYEVGDVLQRKIFIEAANMASMNMPLINPDVPRGVSVTLAEPELSTKSGRQGQFATMTQQMSYAIEKPGQYQLGGEVLNWWDPDKTERVDHTLTVESINAGGIPWRFISTVVMLVLVFLLLVWRLRHSLRHRNATQLAIKKMLHSSAASERLAALYAYADHHQPQTSDPAQLKELLPESKFRVRSVLKGRYSSSGTPDQPSHRQSRDLYRQLKKVLSYRNP
jgi:hypothetical protein